MSKTGLAISVRGVSKKYTIAHGSQKQESTLAEAALMRMKRPFERAPTETFWALKDVAFEVKKGDVVGILGKNGAGKSTLLKILSRITEPTLGAIDLYGRVGSLLEVGSGFHPELTGRENIKLNGAILGMTKAEIYSQLEAIIEFAGVRQFIDTPVKRYSSGMYVRLAFSVAAHLRTEILIVDEVLAVGDVEFQRKCLGKVNEVARDGRTAILVSHNVSAINALCTSAIVLKSGCIEYQGNIDEAQRIYCGAGPSMPGLYDLRRGKPASGTRTVRLLSLEVRDDYGTPNGILRPRHKCEFFVTIDSDLVLDNVLCTIELDSSNGMRAVTLFSGLLEKSYSITRGVSIFCCRVPSLNVIPDEYTVHCWIGTYQEDYVYGTDLAHITVRPKAPSDTFGTGRTLKREYGPCLLDFSYEMVESDA